MLEDEGNNFWEDGSDRGYCHDYNNEVLWLRTLLRSHPLTC